MRQSDDAPRPQRAGWWLSSRAALAGAVVLCLLHAVVADNGQADEKQDSRAPASMILVVLSSDAGPYVRASEAVVAQLTDWGHSVQAVAVEDIADDFRTQADSADVIVAIGTHAANWLNERIQPTDRLIYCMVAGASRLGLDGANVWGVTTDVPFDAQFALIGRALPNARVIGVFFASENDTSRQHLADAQAALPKGWQILTVDVGQYESRADAINALLAKKIDIVWTCPDSAVYNGETVHFLLLSALKSNIPVFGFSESFVRIGALLGVGIDPSVQGCQAADLTDRVLQAVASGSTDTANIPAETVYKIAVNLIVAQRIGVTLPEEVVSSAETVFRPEGDERP